jgi:hypothetical protein
VNLVIGEFQAETARMFATWAGASDIGIFSVVPGDFEVGGDLAESGPMRTSSQIGSPSSGV